MTIDKRGQCLGLPFALGDGAEVEGQVDPLVREQHRLEGGLGRGNGFTTVGQGHLQALLDVDVQADGLTVGLDG